MAALGLLPEAPPVTPAPGNVDGLFTTGGMGRWIGPVKGWPADIERLPLTWIVDDILGAVSGDESQVRFIQVTRAVRVAGVLGSAAGDVSRVTLLSPRRAKQRRAQQLLMFGNSIEE